MKKIITLLIGFFLSVPAWSGKPIKLKPAPKVSFSSSQIANQVTRAYVGQARWQAANAVLLEEIARIDPGRGRLAIEAKRINVLPTFFSYQSNRLLLNSMESIEVKLDWIKQNHKLVQESLLRVTTSINPEQTLAEMLVKEDLVFIGEPHYQVQKSVERLVSFLSRMQPDRKIVVFSEFDPFPLALPVASHTSLQSYSSFYEGEVPTVTQTGEYNWYSKDFVKAMETLNIDVYGLEDPNLLKLGREEVESDVDLSVSPQIILMRNRHWARVMRYIMENVRKDFPDAMFIVYGGRGHFSQFIHASLPSFFPNEKFAVVGIDKEVSASVYGLYGMVDVPEAYQKVEIPTILGWKENIRRTMSRQIGFDYELIFPTKK